MKMEIILFAKTVESGDYKMNEKEKIDSIKIIIRKLYLMERKYRNTKETRLYIQENIKKFENKLIELKGEVQ